MRQVASLSCIMCFFGRCARVRACGCARARVCECACSMRERARVCVRMRALIRVLVRAGILALKGCGGGADKALPCRAFSDGAQRSVHLRVPSCWGVVTCKRSRAWRRLRHRCLRHREVPQRALPLSPPKPQRRRLQQSPRKPQWALPLPPPKPQRWRLQRSPQNLQLRRLQQQGRPVSAVEIAAPGGTAPRVSWGGHAPMPPPVATTTAHGAAARRLTAVRHVTGLRAASGTRESWGSCRRSCRRPPCSAPFGARCCRET